MSDREPTEPGSARFPTTAWAALEEMKATPEDERTEQRNRLIVNYWKPVFCFLRAWGRPHHQAEELTQEFFADLLGGDDILGADRAQGKFRTFLLTLLKRFLSDRLNPERRPRQQSFEEGVVAIGSLFTDAERPYEPPTHVTPDTEFMRKWVRGLLANVEQQVKDLYDKRGQPEMYELFRVAQDVKPGAPRPTQEELGAEFGLDAEGVKYRLRLVKQSFLVQLRTEVRKQVSSATEVDEEIAELFALLAS
jgi:RNA polymerase sigma-70 factor (ECF subfamily)